jgi:hypothetical protein
MRVRSIVAVNVVIERVEGVGLAERAGDVRWNGRIVVAAGFEPEHGWRWRSSRNGTGRRREGHASSRQCAESLPGIDSTGARRPLGIWAERLRAPELKPSGLRLDEAIARRQGGMRGSRR